MRPAREGRAVALAIATWCASVAIGTACRGDPAGGPSDLDVRLGISPTPPTAAPTRILIDVSRGGVPVRGARVQVEGGMNHAGMIPVFDRASETGDGRYVVAGFPFSMRGDWILEVRVEEEEGGVVIRRFPVRVYGAGEGP